MSFLAELDRYLTVRRQLGADLSTNERILRRFATFADCDDVNHALA
jgi:integrase/recombinase XerD